MSNPNLPSLPPAGNTSWYSHYSALDSTLRSNSDNGGVHVDAFAGGSDDAKLTAAMSYAASQTHPPALLLSNRDYYFGTQRIPYTGFRLIGANRGIANSELGAANTATRINLSYNGPWIYVTGGDLWNCLISGIVFVGNSGSTFMGCDGSSVFHGSHLRDLSFHQVKTVLGTQAQKLLMTTCLIDGWFQMQGTYNGGIHIGGSDNRLFLGGFLIDGSQAYNDAGGAAGQFHIWCDGLDNSALGPIYMTAQGTWGGVRVTGSAYNSPNPSNMGMVWCWGATIEGQSGVNPCLGALIKVEGGNFKLRDSYVGRSMSNPGAMGHSPTDAGAIHITGGQVLLDGITFDRATGVPESVPFVYNNGGQVRVSNTFTATKGGTWVGKPQVKALSGSTHTDDTVTVV